MWLAPCMHASQISFQKFCYGTKLCPEHIWLTCMLISNVITVLCNKIFMMHLIQFCLFTSVSRLLISFQWNMHIYAYISSTSFKMQLLYNANCLPACIAYCTVLYVQCNQYSQAVQLLGLYNVLYCIVQLYSVLLQALDSNYKSSIIQLIISLGITLDMGAYHKKTIQVF